MPDPLVLAPPQPLCASDDLIEKGRAVLFDVLHFGQPVRAFALRFDGRVVAYLNRCVHVPTEMDWQPGEFLDAERALIVCSMHGATYQPSSGRCVGGPCGRGRLSPVDVVESDGKVRWYPSRDIRPVEGPPGGCEARGTHEHS
jgi:nitrite reductase/ring-hydroxylating ferredoxin subunit